MCLMFGGLGGGGGGGGMLVELAEASCSTFLTTVLVKSLAPFREVQGRGAREGENENTSMDIEFESNLKMRCQPTWQVVLRVTLHLSVSHILSHTHTHTHSL
ncbi:hypothetical protein GOP47_0030343 [Adiantum capillus-veneris]|nr:hypothetical protein GOP47_0030343 [Adiantum capillus-veneris]